MIKLVLDVHEKPKKLQWLLLSFQHVFAMFGATILVPVLTGLDIGVALVASGCGTLIYILCTKAKVPVYLGSSFAYIGAIVTATQESGVESAFIGLISVGLIYTLVSIIIKFTGKGWIEKILPPLIVGPMIIIIGLSLAGTAVSSAGLDGADSSSWRIMLVAVITFLTTVLVALKGKGFSKIIPFLIGILTGYISAVILNFIPGASSGFMDFSHFSNATFFQIPKFQFIGTYDLDFSAILMFAPLAFVTICEHIGDHKVLGSVTGKDYLKEPGLDRTLLGDGLATLFSGLIGGPANTTYGENTGVISMTKVASVWVIGGAALIAICLGFLGYVQAFIQTIPNCVMGGVSIVLFGMIASNGLKVIGDSKINLYETRNIIIIAAMLVIGLGGAVINIFGTSIEKMALAVLVGVVLNLILPKEKIKGNNEEAE
ncbi:MAG: solute carrier family 23 protein [bacterium]